MSLTNIICHDRAYNFFHIQKLPKDCLSLFFIETHESHINLYINQTHLACLTKKFVLISIKAQQAQDNLSFI